MESFDGGQSLSAVQRETFFLNASEFIFSELMNSLMNLAYNLDLPGVLEKDTEDTQTLVTLTQQTFHHTDFQITLKRDSLFYRHLSTRK